MFQGIYRLCEGHTPLFELLLYRTMRVDEIAACRPTSYAFLL
jgi:hypothetical protein